MEDDVPVNPEKKIVFYTPREGVTIEVGYGTDVNAINHPNLGTKWVATSRVLRYIPETGYFETENTNYLLKLN